MTSTNAPTLSETYPYHDFVEEGLQLQYTIASQDLAGLDPNSRTRLLLGDRVNGAAKSSIIPGERSVSFYKTVNRIVSPVICWDLYSRKG